MFSLNQTCLNFEIGRVEYYEEPIAINADYLAISNKARSSVSIFFRNFFGRWQKKGNILRPKNSIFRRYRESFGIKLQLERNILAISSRVTIPASAAEKHENFTYRDGFYYFTGIYLARLDSKSELKFIETNERLENEYKNFYFLLDGKINKVTLPKNGEDRFGFSSAVYNNLLLVGSPTRDRGGKAWLFNLNALEEKPLKIAKSNIYNGTSVAVSESFAAISDVASALFDPYNSSGLRSRVLIKSLKNGSTSVIESFGRVSLSDNILAIMLSPYFGYRNPILQVYRLNKYAVPNLILEYKKINLEYAFVQNGFLVTVLKKFWSEKQKVCIKTIR